MSVANRLRTEVQTLVIGLGLNVTPGPPPVLAVVKVRKRPEYRKGDGSGVITVSGREIGRELLTAEDSSAYLVRYGFTVVGFIPNLNRTAPDGTIDDWREAIRKAVDIPGAVADVVTEVSHIEVVERPFFSLEALSLNYDVAAVAFDVYTIEAR